MSEDAADVKCSPDEIHIPTEYRFKDKLSHEEYRKLCWIIKDISEVTLVPLDPWVDSFRIRIEADSQQRFMAALMKLDLRLRGQGFRHKLSMFQPSY